MSIEAFAPQLPDLVGGSADLAHSNLILWKGSKSVAGDGGVQRLAAQLGFGQLDKGGGAVTQDGAVCSELGR